MVWKTAIFWNAFLIDKKSPSPKLQTPMAAIAPPLPEEFSAQKKTFRRC